MNENFRMNKRLVRVILVLIFTAVAVTAIMILQNNRLQNAAAYDEYTRYFFEIRAYYSLSAEDRAVILSEFEAERLQINMFLRMYREDGTVVADFMHAYRYIGRRSPDSYVNGGILHSFSITENYFSVIFYRDSYPVRFGSQDVFYFPDSYMQKQDLEFGTYFNIWMPLITFTLQAVEDTEQRTIFVRGLRGLRADEPPPLRGIWWLIAHGNSLSNGNDNGNDNGNGTDNGCGDYNNTDNNDSGNSNDSENQNRLFMLIIATFGLILIPSIIYLLYLIFFGKSKKQK